MRRPYIVTFAAGLGLLALPGVAKTKSKTPPGVPVEARLLTPLASYTARRGMEVEAALAMPVCPANGQALPAGALIRGSIVKAHRVGLGLLHETAAMRIEFRELRLPDGRAYPIQAQLTGIENAREHVDRNGTIRGIRATAAISNRVGQRLAFLAMDHPLPLLPLMALQMGVLRFANPEIELKRGADFHLAMQFPAEFGSVSRCDAPEELTSREWTDLQSVVDGLPYWSYAQGKGEQGEHEDPVNLVFVGSQDEITRAFQAAGWLGSLPNSARAGFKAIRAIAEHRELADGPMRILLLDGAPPDLRLQKSLDTFEKRDHLRIWARPDMIDGRPVWASAATRDVATTFSTRPFGFTHEIEGDVDRERDQVVNDLAFTGCVDWVAYVARPKTLRAAGQGFRKGLSTDSRVAVAKLNACTSPREDLSVGGAMRRPGKLTRAIRRVMLVARNHFLRDNLVWRTGDAIRMAVQSERQWRRKRREEVSAQALDSQLNLFPELRRSFAVCRSGCTGLEVNTLTRP